MAQDWSSGRLATGDWRLATGAQMGESSLKPNSFPKGSTGTLVYPFQLVSAGYCTRDSVIPDLDFSTKGINYHNESAILTVGPGPVRVQ